MATVLIVEDDDAVRKLLRMALSESGFTVTESASVADAMTALRKHGIEAVVVDLMLVDGHAGPLLEHLRKAQPALPWVVTSGEPQPAAELRFGSFDGRFISKPYDPWVVAAHIKKSLAPESSTVG